jgi:hypothetical protein
MSRRAALVLASLLSLLPGCGSSEDPDAPLTGGAGGQAGAGGGAAGSGAGGGAGHPVAGGNSGPVSGGGTALPGSGGINAWGDEPAGPKTKKFRPAWTKFFAMPGYVDHRLAGAAGGSVLLAMATDQPLEIGPGITVGTEGQLAIQLLWIGDGGEVSRTRSLPCAASCALRSLWVSPAGDAVMTGTTTGGIGLGDASLAPGEGEFVVFLSPEGDVRWARLFKHLVGGSPSDSWTDTRGRSDDTGVVIGGSIQGDVAIEGTSYAGETADLFMVKFSLDGQLLWARRVAAPADQWVTSLALLPGGDAVLGARVKGQIELGGVKHPADDTDISPALLLSRWRGSDGAIVWGMDLGDGNAPLGGMDEILVVQGGQLVMLNVADVAFSIGGAKEGSLFAVNVDEPGQLGDVRVFDGIHIESLYDWPQLALQGSRMAIRASGHVDGLTGPYLDSFGNFAARLDSDGAALSYVELGPVFTTGLAWMDQDTAVLTSFGGPGSETGGLGETTQLGLFLAGF